jgi:diaminopimelate epimerase
MVLTPSPLIFSSGGPGDKTYKISTLAGTIVPVVRDDGLVTVDMGEPILEGTHP